MLKNIKLYLKEIKKNLFVTFIVWKGLWNHDSLKIWWYLDCENRSIGQCDWSIISIFVKNFSFTITSLSNPANNFRQEQSIVFDK